MVWTSEHDEMLCREILVVNPFAGTKRRTIQRGAKWGTIAENLNKIEQVYFRVDKRAVRDRYNLLAKETRTKLRKEKSASGIEVDLSEVEKALEDIIEIEDAAEMEEQAVGGQKREKENKEREEAETIRKTAMESLGQTQKRNAKSNGNDTPPVKRRRANGSDAVNYLREKSNIMQQLHTEELQLKRVQLEAESKRHDDFMQAMLNQQQVQQQQMKQQNDMMLALLSQVIQNQRN